MPAKDKYHDIVRNALIKDGWTITHDPYPLKLGKSDLFIDLGAEKIIAAEKGNERNNKIDKRILTEFAVA